MKKIRKGRLIALISCIAFLLINAVCALIVIAENNKKSVVWDEVQISDAYLVGDSFIVPSVQVSLGDTAYQTQFTLRFPDGKSYADADGDNATESEFILTQAGIYTLKYSAKVESETLSKTYNFTVKQTVYSVSSENSYAQYGEVSYPKVNGTESVTKTGLSVKLSAGDTFNYNKIVDLSKKDSLQNILTFSVLPQVDRELDVSGITIVLTDAYDAQNRVEIKVKAIVNATTQTGWDIAYTSACAPSAGQITSGYSPGSVPEVQVNTVYGRAAWFPFYGSDWNKTSSALEHSLTINYDYAEKQVFVGTALVADLDDSFFFKQKLWSGFTTGEVFVSVVGNTYYKDYAQLLITELCGEQMQENGILERNSTPTILLDSLGIDLDNVSSVIGYKFPVFNATAIDAYDGELPVTIKAYNAYYSSSRNELDIVGGYFVPDRLGVVTLEYSTQKKDGTVCTKLVDIQIKADATLGVTIADERVTSGIAGDIILIASYAVQGSVGNSVSEITVTLGEKNVEIENGAFKAVSAGEYIVRVQAKDVIGQTAQSSYSVTIGANANPVFYGEAIVPKYFIVGQKYSLPAFPAYDYSANVERQIQTKLTVNGVEGASFTPSSEGEVTVEYTAQTAVGLARKIYQSKAVSVKTDEAELIFSKYFDTKNLAVSVNNTGVDFTAESVAQETETTFINYLNSYDFSVEFAVNPAKASFDTIDVYLADITGANDGVKVSINILSNKVSVNGKQTDIAVDGAFLFDKTGKSSLRLALDARVGVLTVGSAMYNLEKFTDFSGSLLSLRFALTGVKGDAEFSVRKIGNQVLKSTVKRDNISPVVLYNGKYDIYKNAGDILTVYKAVIGDVLSPIAESYVSVKAPNGDFAVATDGTKMNKVPCDRDYQIELSEYGSYRIDYYAKDGAGQKASGTTSTLQVIDKEPPVIVVNGSTPKTAKIGDIIKVPSFTITDNKDSEFTVTLILMNSFEGIRKVLKEDYFVVSEEGSYILTILCYDKAGNMATVTVTVKVEV